jgi:phosphodiesterase/alkaline phosphatase D-like protein
VTPVLLAYLTYGDSWACGGYTDRGFENELFDIIDIIEKNGIENLLWLSGDRHFAQVNSYDVTDDGATDFYEATSGPLGAFKVSPSQALDESLNPTTLYKVGEFLNFGQVTVAEDGSNLTIEIVDKDGEVHHTTTIKAQ